MNIDPKKFVEDLLKESNDICADVFTEPKLTLKEYCAIQAALEIVLVLMKSSKVKFADDPDLMASISGSQLKLESADRRRRDVIKSKLRDRAAKRIVDLVHGS
jgi:hypothetical protein